MSKPIFTVIFGLAAIITFTHGACDNQCSGHGTCMTDDVCDCYDNWGVGLSHQSGDCSERVCPYELAWVDTPDKDGAFHKYAECANRGICNRDTGECACFDGYEGKGCQRTTCPNDCSGHGTCEFIEDLGFAATWNDYTPVYFSDDLKTFAYTNWDAGKIRGCVCDAHYGDVDCSKKMCPYGTDVLDTRDDLLVSTKYQVQTLEFMSNTHGVWVPGSNPRDFKSIAPGSNLYGETFALTFKSKLNETFTTIPIPFDNVRDDLDDFANDIQLALLNLPNKVIDGVKVTITSDDVVDLPINTNIGIGGQAGIDFGVAKSQMVKVHIMFTGPSVQGPQHLLTVEDYFCGNGCTPKLTGLSLETRYRHPTSNITETTEADYNSYECGRRGKCDYTTGLCSCFTGYTGENCNTLTTLV